MTINSMIREHNFCGIVASTHEHVYNAWMRGDTLHFYVLSDENRKQWPTFRDMTSHFIARIGNGKIKLVIDGVAFTLYSHDELMNTIRCAFPDEWHDIKTIIETLLYTE